MSQWFLTLMRHGSAVSPAHVERDFDRALTHAGEREVLAAAQGYQAVCPVPHKILASPAKRTLQTAEIVRRQLALPLDCLERVPAIYDADLRTLVELIIGHDPAHTHVLLVGHNPGMEVLARYFVGGGQRPVTFLPTTIVTLQFDVTWAEMGETLARVQFTR